MRRNLIITVIIACFLPLNGANALAVEPYTTKPGECLAGIAAKFGVTTRSLEVLNQLEGQEPATGTRLIIPAGESVSRSGSIRNIEGYPDLVDYGKTFLGTPYVWGGTSPAGFDCSGFVQYLYGTYCGCELPRVAADQYAAGSPVDQSQLQPGDLVFFSQLSHVGMYAGGRQFIHSSSPSSGGVIMSSLDEDYYASRYYGAVHITL